MRRLLTPFLALAAATALLFAGAPALGHTALVSSNPKANSTVHELPDEVTLTFTEDLQAEVSKIEVVDGEGLDMTKGKPTTDGPTLTQALADSLHPGPYVVTYKVISGDGHPVTGAIPFTIAEDAVPLASSTSPSDSPSASATGPTANASSEPTGSATTSSAPVTSATSAATTSAPATGGESGADDGSGRTALWLFIGAGVVLGLIGGRLLRGRADRANRSRG